MVGHTQDTIQNEELKTRMTVAEENPVRILKTLGEHVQIYTGM